MQQTAEEYQNTTVAIAVRPQTKKDCIPESGDLAAGAFPLLQRLFPHFYLIFSQHSYPDAAIYTAHGLLWLPHSFHIIADDTYAPGKHLM